MTDGDLGRPTPCDEFDVAALRGHLLAVMSRIARIGEVGDVAGEASIVDAVPAEDWSAAWAEAAHRAQRAWADEARLDATVTVPWAQLPGRIALAIYTSEITVHTWDLLVAIGRAAAFDDRVVEMCLASMRFGLPAEGRDDGITPFASVVSVSDDAPLIDQLVAWTGRNPAWLAAA